MTLKKQLFAQAEFIGRTVEVIDTPNRALVGLRGTIIDETKHTLTLATHKGRKRLIKAVCLLAFTTPEGTITLSGKQIEKRPEERITKHR